MYADIKKISKSRFSEQKSMEDFPWNKTVDFFSFFVTNRQDGKTDI